VGNHDDLFIDLLAAQVVDSLSPLREFAHHHSYLLTVSIALWVIYRNLEEVRVSSSHRARGISDIGLRL
jgi:hypothetical protein